MYIESRMFVFYSIYLYLIKRRQWACSTTTRRAHQTLRRMCWEGAGYYCRKAVRSYSVRTQGRLRLLSAISHTTTTAARTANLTVLYVPPLLDNVPSTTLPEAERGEFPFHSSHSCPFHLDIRNISL